MAAVALVVAALVAGSSGLAAADGRNSSGANLVPAGRPQTVVIPRIGVRATVESVPLDRPEDIHAPFRWEDAGWYSRGSRPGAIGRSVIFGHLDSTCCPAVFWSLNTLQPGDAVQVSYGSRTLTFRVMWQHTYLNSELPLRWLFGGGKQRALVLFTCAGVFHHDGTGYDHKLVIFARLVMPNGRLG